MSFALARHIDWSLRDYGTPPLVFGGDAGCVHSWGDEQTTHTGNSPSAKTTMTGGMGIRESDSPTASQGQFCRLCSAWRGSLGLEPTPALYVEHIVEVMRGVWRVLRDDGMVWFNIADTAAKKPFPPWGVKVKDEVGIPDEVKKALRMDGWYVRKSIVWAKGVSFCPTYSGSCMPESVRDRPTTSYEMVFLLSKSAHYFYDNEAVKESSVSQGYADKPLTSNRPGWSGNPNVHGEKGHPLPGTWQNEGGRNLRSVWTINPGNFKGSHFAAYPPALVRPMILAGTSARGVCPECGAGWVRVTEKTGSTTTEKRKALGTSQKRGNGGRLVTQNLDYAGGHGTNIRESTTLCWTPGCQCNAGEPVPATVLDIFGGSGTTAAVAEELGRDSIIIDLSGDYCDMARRRIDRTPEIETVLNGEAVTVEQVPMFEVVT